MEDNITRFKAAFADIIAQHPIIFSRSQLPDIRILKSKAINDIKSQIQSQFNISLTEKQLSKKFQNLKSRLKANLKRSDIETIVLKDWEQKWLNIMRRENEVTACRLKATKSVGVDTSGMSEWSDVHEFQDGGDRSPIESPEPGPPSQPETERELEETEETKHLAAVELQELEISNQEGNFTLQNMDDIKDDCKDTVSVVSIVKCEEIPSSIFFPTLKSEPEKELSNVDMVTERHMVMIKEEPLPEVKTEDDGSPELSVQLQCHDTMRDKETDDHTNKCIYENSGYPPNTPDRIATPSFVQVEDEDNTLYLPDALSSSTSMPLLEAALGLSSSMPSLETVPSLSISTSLLEALPGPNAFAPILNAVQNLGTSKSKRTSAQFKEDMAKKTRKSMRPGGGTITCNITKSRIGLDSTQLVWFDSNADATRKSSDSISRPTPVSALQISAGSSTQAIQNRPLSSTLQLSSYSTLRQSIAEKELKARLRRNKLLKKYDATLKSLHEQKLQFLIDDAKQKMENFQWEKERKKQAFKAEERRKEELRALQLALLKKKSAE
ncbi:uncharacterized protein [Periplaneta americana]|uniref:uncharacterized protein isoform X2 n=1 Tax=Periplaneta americana TaxID=6978 RepID=UPI0037E7E51F